MEYNNEDLLGDDIGDQSLADYNLGNEEEEQLLADDYENGGPQNVPVSLRDDYSQSLVPLEFPNRVMDYMPQVPYRPIPDTESVVPNITVEVPNIPHSTYAPADPRHYEAEHAVPPAMPAMPMESPQIVPSEIPGSIPNSEMGRERFVTERPIGAQRMPQVRDIPDSLDKVVIPRGGYPARGRTSWRAPHLAPRYAHPYRRHNLQRGNFSQRSSFPPPQIVRPNIPPQIRPDIRSEMIRPDIRQELRPEIRQDMIRPEIRPEMGRPEIRHDMRPEMNRLDMIPPEIRPETRPEMHPEPNQMGPEISPERPILPDMFRPNRFQPFNRFEFRDERPHFNPVRPPFERPMYPYPRQFGPRFPPREIVPNAISHIPQVTIRQAVPALPLEPEVRMLPVQLPPHLPPAGLAGKKVLINPHFKGNFQPPVDGLPAYIPTRIQKSPPLSPPLEKKFGPIKDIDDAAERFIAEQRNALARAASRKFNRRSPQRYIENTTIEIANELARAGSEERDLLRRQEEFISANRAGLRRRMRSPSPPPPARRSPPSPRRRPDSPREHHDEESDYKRRLREQETLRERVLRAKEVRRRKNAITKLMEDRERETQDKSQPPPTKESQPPKEEPPKPKEPEKPSSATPEPEKPKLEKPKPEKPVTEAAKPDTTRKTPERRTPEIEVKDKRRKSAEDIKEKEKVRERSPVKPKDDEVNSTCDGLTPPWRGTSDDELDLILGDIDGFLSDDDSGRFKQHIDKSPPEPKVGTSDLRSKLPPRDRQTRQKIVFTDNRDDKRKREKTPPRRAVVSSTKVDEEASDRKSSKSKPKQEQSTNKSRQRITFNKDKEQEKEKESQDKTPPFSNRRVILQRNTTKDKSLAGVFGRTVRTVFGDKKKHEPKVEIESDSDLDEEKLLNDEIGNMAVVTNLPHGMTDTRLRTLAGNDVQNLMLDKEDRSAKVTFKTTIAAENFKKKFNNKMVAASRLSVTLR